MQIILITLAIIGKLKAWSYVGFVVLFSTMPGLADRAWVDGIPFAILALLISSFVGLLIAMLYF